MSGIRRPWYTVPDMDWKIELIAIPVTDVDRAKAFYVDQAGFHADHDYQVNAVGPWRNGTAVVLPGDA